MKSGIYCAPQALLKTIRPEQVLVNAAYRLSTCAYVKENEILWQDFHNVLGAQTLSAKVNLQVSALPKLMALSVLNKRKSHTNMEKNITRFLAQFSSESESYKGKTLSCFIERGKQHEEYASALIVYSMQ